MRALRRPTRTDLEHLALAIGVAILAWHAGPELPEGGIDPSWRAGLAMAAHENLTFGTDVVFTYGPLGFVKYPGLWYAEEYRWALAYQLTLQVSVAAILLAALRRTFSTWLAVAMAIVVLSLLREDAALVAAAVGALHLIATRGRPSIPLAAGLGALAAIELLGKLSIGLVVFLMLGAAVAAHGRRGLRALAAYAVTAMVAFSGLWVALGQDLSGIVGYVRHGLAVGSGYSEAMGVTTPGKAWQFWVALVVVGCVIAGAAGYRELPRARRRAAWLVLAVAVLISFKEGFVRHDEHHDLLFFSAMLALVPALAWGRARQGTALLATLLAAVALVGVTGNDPAGQVNPLGNPQALVDAVRLAVSAEERGDAVEPARAAMLAAYALDPATQELLAEGSVHVVPVETAVVWALGLDWSPLPVFQDYQAYSGSLDELNADRLASDQAPERILRGTTSLTEGRFGGWDPPAQQLALLCGYRQVHATDRWQVLARAATRCGEPEPLTTVRASFGEPVPVPDPGDSAVVVAEVRGLEVAGLERVVSFLFKPADRSVTTDAGTVYRLPPRLAGGPLVVAASPGVDHPAPFAVAAGARTLTFRQDREEQPDGPVEVVFSRVPVDGPPLG